MDGLAAGLRDGRGDNMGAGAAREAAEELIEAARHVRSLTGAESPALLLGVLRRLTAATEAAERLHERQLSAAMIRVAHHREDYADGYADGCAAVLAARHLHPVG